MDPERWRRIDDLFARALERSDTERAGFLAAQCGDDVELLGELAEIKSGKVTYRIVGIRDLRLAEAWLRTRLRAGSA